MRGPHEVLRRHNGVSRYLLWYGRKNRKDATFAAELETLPGVEAYGLDTDNHLIARYLHDLGQLPSLPVETGDIVAPRPGAGSERTRCGVDLDRESVEREVVDFIMKTFADVGAQLDRGTNLADLGILDSFAIVSLLEFVEDRFGVSLSLSGPNTGWLNSVAGIAASVLDASTKHSRCS